MEFVLGALPSLLPKLVGLLVGEYNLQKEVKGGIKFLLDELESMKCALERISETPVDQLDKHDMIWAREVRELSYDIEDKIDIVMVGVLGSEPAKQQDFRTFMGKTIRNLKQPKGRRKIAVDIRDLKCRVEELAKRRVPELAKLRDRYTVGNVVAKPIEVDPRLLAQFKRAAELVGIDEARDEVIQILMEGKDASKKQCNIVSIVGLGGIGKTTLANAVYEKLRAQFDCGAFVSVSQTPDMKKLFKGMLWELSKNINEEALDEGRLIYLLRDFLQNKRFFVVLDDICDSKAWDIVRCALIENSNSSAVLTTSRDKDTTDFTGESLQRLSEDECKQIFCQKLFGSHKCPPEMKEVLGNLIATCGGILSVIIDIVELLASKPKTPKDWQAVYERRIFALSYADLPDHLKNCLLYFILFEKGYEVRREHLVWGWIAEGFVQKIEGQTKTLQEVAESYLTELIKKRMIEAVQVDAGGQALSCRAYDFVHDFINSKSTEAKSTEANFAAILDGQQGRSFPDTCQRLSIKGNNKEQSLPQGLLSQVKSIIVSGDTVPSLSDYPNLCVLDLGDCDSLKDDHLKGIRNSQSLRHLVIGGTCITGIPKEIGNLKYLQTLDLSASDLNELPESVYLLRELERLYVNSHMKIPKGIRKLSSLQELGDINIIKPGLLKELCGLTKLKVLRIAMWSWDESWKSSVKQLRDNLRSLLQSGNNIQSLSILTCCSLDFMDQDLGAEWSPPRPQKLEIRYSCFDALPNWIVSLQNLSSLSIEVYKLPQEMINLLGTKLPTLHSLSLTSKHVPQGMFGIDPDGFKNLASLKFVSNAMVQMFAPEPGAMEKLKRLTLTFQASRTKDKNPDFSFGLEKLCPLDHVRVEIICLNASRRVVEHAEVAIRGAISSRHQNPEIRRIQEEDIVAEVALRDKAQESSLSAETRDKSRLPVARRSARQQPNRRKITQYFTSISSTARQQPNQRKITQYFFPVSSTTNMACNL